jgi:chemotaxis protein methyltransferase CheR
MRDPVVGAREVERFRAFVTGWLGFGLEDEKFWSLSGLLLARLRERGCDAETYLSGLEKGASGQELRALAHELTINETSFFRNPEQMAAFAEVALPERLTASTGPLRILSAGCASGEETYSLAIIVRSLAAHAARPIVITGIDADATVLKKAAAGRYSAWSLRQTPPGYRADFFRAAGREFALAETIRKMVNFEERNLLAADPAFWAPGAFDIIFCRNVIMYFTPQVARAVVARLAASLTPGGFLFLGLAETLRGLSEAFDLRHSHGTFYYQQRARPPQARGPGIAAEPDFVAAIESAARRIQALAAAAEDSETARRRHSHHAAGEGR